MAEVKRTGVAAEKPAASAIPASTTASATRTAPGLTFRRLFTKPGVSPYDEIEWEKRIAQITDSKGGVIFEQKDVEVPKDWSMTATNIVASKYLHGTLGTPERESGVRALVTRVAETIRDWGLAQGYFRTPEDGATFHDELAHILLRQYADFNSPVWFNVGCDRIEPNSDGQNWHWNAKTQTVEFGITGYSKPQCSACFINSVKDSLDSILTLAKTEGMLFKWGSGTGTNLSSLRSSKEHLSTGGKASGPVSFMKGFDAFAGVIKSGGRTRRAAKMVILNVDHPDIEEFIWSKAKEEKKAWALIDAGYDGAVDGEAYSSIFFQNANHSVRVTDEFMHAVTEDKEWKTRFITNHQVADVYKARNLMREMAEAAYICGDPGIQFDTIVNKWHPCPNTNRINASNPCSEYMFLDDSACNLASLNLMKFRTIDGEFDVESFEHAVDIVISAQEILVSNAGYPTPAIEKNSHDFRPLGLGYANLGALLMARGLPYDSDEGRNYAAAISALMSGRAYAASSRVAKRLGPFNGYAVNEKPFLNVVDMHRAHAYKIPAEGVSEELSKAALRSWDDALSLGERFGFKNAQISVIAPTGTIAFMMDCDTTGIEPDIALIKYKWLVGGGVIKIVNNTVPEALTKIGYSKTEASEILKYLEDHDTIEGAPHLKQDHLPVFDCAFKPAKGTRNMHYMGHVKMMAAVQPFISGAISKTVNMPGNVSVDEIVETYITAWKMGLKAIAIYRDGSKRTQPLTTTLQDKGKAVEKTKEQVVFKPFRRRLPEEREAIIHKFSIAQNEGYLMVGLYDDGTPGEIFVVMSKEGSTISGLMDAFSTSISLALQYGVPLKVLVNKFTHTRFEPAGITTNQDIRFAKSVVDYIFRWLGLKFLPKEEQDALGLARTTLKNGP